MNGWPGAGLSCSISCCSDGLPWHPSGDRGQGGQRACLFRDEIQLIAGWEGFVRRVIDSKPIDVVITGSSARMLSAWRVYPFSLREVLRHQGLAPEQGQHLRSAQRSRLQQGLLSYLMAGGFPEAQGGDARFCGYRRGAAEGGGLVAGRWRGLSLLIGVSTQATAPLHLCRQNERVDG
jgi:hypothetical protein